MTILKTCDMGLLMGAPILNNILARMSRDFQRAFGALAQVQEHHAGNNDPKSHADNSFEKDFQKNVISRKRSYNELEAEKEISDTGDKNSNEESNMKNSCTEKNDSPTDSQKQVNVVTMTSDQYRREVTNSPSAYISIPPKIHSQTTREIPRCSCPSVEMFSAMFVDCGHPVIITDAIGYWPALTSRRWSLDYLRKVAGNRTVPVELGSRYTEESWSQKLMTINEMIDSYIENPKPEDKAYLAQHQLFDQVSNILKLNF